MAAGEWNPTIEQGATWESILTYKIDDVAVNLSGYSARLTAKDSAGTAVLEMDTATLGGITLGGAAGTITLNLTAAETTALAAGVYTYDLELESGAGVVTRLVQGDLTVSAERTT